MSSWKTWESTLVSTSRDISQVVDDEIFSWRERRVRAYCSLAPNEILMLEVTGQVLLEAICYTPVLERPI